MEYQPTGSTSLNLTNFSNGSISHLNGHVYLIESFRVVFTVIGMTIGIVGIGVNTALIISLAIMTSSLTAFSLKTRNLIISLGAADICLLVFGLPYDLAAANNVYPWLEGRAGCQMSAYLPEMSRFVWVGSVMLSLPPYRWPSGTKVRNLATTWTILVWTFSLIVAIPFALHVDCLGTFDYTPEDKLDDALVPAVDGACSCVFTVSQSQVAQMFGSSLVVLLLVLVATIARISCCKHSWSSVQEIQSTAHHHKLNTSPKTTAVMLLVFMGCTLPRYVYIVVNYCELPSTTNRDYELAFSAVEILCYCLFYSSTLIHLLASPHPRFLLAQLFNHCRHRSADYSIGNQAA